MAASPANTSPSTSILDLYADLRSQLHLEPSYASAADAFSAALALVEGASRNPKTIIQLQSFLVQVGYMNQQPDPRILRVSPDTIIRDEHVIHAWATLLSLEQVSDASIWSALNHLVSVATGQPANIDGNTSPSEILHRTGVATAPSPVTPPRRPPHVQDDTPFHANSSLSFSSSRTHAVVDPYLRTELRDTVLKDVKGFYRFFHGITEAEWNCVINCPFVCACSWPESRSGDNSGAVTHSVVSPFPPETKPSERSVLGWFATFNQHLDSSPSPRQFYTSSTRSLTHSSTSSQRLCDLFLAPTITTDTCHLHAWPNVLVPAELKASPTQDCSSDTIVQLASYAREVFGAQVNRRFVHAFTICGQFLRCYLFDRAGVSISERLHVGKNDKAQALFGRILKGYAGMSAPELGFDIHYEYSSTPTGTESLSSIPTSSTPEPRFLHFQNHRFKLIRILFHRPVIVSRGTLCWLAVDVDSGEECVIKDSWRASWRTSEGELLARAKDCGVWGISKLLFYGDVKWESGIDRIGNLREGLAYNSASRVMLPMKLADGMYVLSSARTVPVKALNLTSGTAMAKRPSHSREQTSSGPRKAAKLNGSNRSRTSRGSYERVSEQSRSLKKNNDDTSPIENFGTMRQSSSTTATPIPVTPTTEYSTLIDPSCPRGLFMDLTHSIIITSSVGETIENFTSIRELLEVFRDAIKCM